MRVSIDLQTKGEGATRERRLKDERGVGYLSEQYLTRGRGG